MTTHEGGCDCGKVRYRLQTDPIIVHCCHCSWCQRESGAAFALNAVIETDRIELLGEAPERTDLPSASGKGQTVLHCPSCNVALWSHFGGAGEKAGFIRVGTLDNPDACPPDVHIFTGTKQSWVVLPEGAEAFDTFYSGEDAARIYGAESGARWQAMMGG